MASRFDKVLEEASLYLNDLMEELFDVGDQKGADMAEELATDVMADPFQFLENIGTFISGFAPGEKRDRLIGIQKGVEKEIDDQSS